MDANACYCVGHVVCVMSHSFSSNSYILLNFRLSFTSLLVTLLGIHSPFARTSREIALSSAKRGHLFYSCCVKAESRIEERKLLQPKRYENSFLNLRWSFFISLMSCVYLMSS
jgi:hypothetical protein